MASKVKKRATARWRRASRACAILMKRSSLDEINVLEILDRVLDNGIVVDPSARVYLIGNELHVSKGRMVVESVRTHL